MDINKLYNIAGDNLQKTYNIAINYADLNKLRELYREDPDELGRIKETPDFRTYIGHFKGHYTRLMEAIV